MSLSLFSGDVLAAVTSSARGIVLISRSRERGRWFLTTGVVVCDAAGGDWEIVLDEHAEVGLEANEDDEDAISDEDSLAGCDSQTSRVLGSTGHAEAGPSEDWTDGEEAGDGVGGACRQNSHDIYARDSRSSVRQKVCRKWRIHRLTL